MQIRFARACRGRGHPRLISVEPIHVRDSRSCDRRSFPNGLALRNGREARSRFDGFDRCKAQKGHRDFNRVGTAQDKALERSTKSGSWERQRVVEGDPTRGHGSLLQPSLDLEPPASVRSVVPRCLPPMLHPRSSHWRACPSGRASLSSDHRYRERPKA